LQKSNQMLIFAKNTLQYEVYVQHIVAIYNRRHQAIMVWRRVLWSAMSGPLYTGLSSGYYLIDTTTNGFGLGYD